MPDSRIADTHALMTQARGGSLTIVGTGIQAFAHLTREAEGHIRHADVVFHCIRDPLAVADLHALNPNVIDLTSLYGAEKRRSLTYVQMADAMLAEVRAGRRVTGVFYGHPGFYVAPARLGLATAKKEGYATRLLPGISSLDYLFADLRVDPSQVGYQALEATDFLLRNRPLVTTGHVVLMQIGPVGDLFQAVTDNLERRAILFDRLIDIYGADHPCVDYVGATRPGQKPVLRRLPLGAYRDPAVLKRVSKASTLYIPPKDTVTADAAMMARLGIGGMKAAPTAADEPVALAPATQPLVSDAFFQAMKAIAENPDAAQAFRNDPARYVATFGIVMDAEGRWLSGLGKTAAKAVPEKAEELNEHNDVEELNEHNDAEELNEHNDAEELNEHNHVEDLNEKASLEELNEHNDVEELNEHNDVEELNEDSDVEELNEHNDVEELNEHNDVASN
ncbi:MAG: SAM-dependent methyltransferase [Azospirillaceae bacterium]|nr:SAM-dependent methyltransferase [Azospirillaceae bacterium]